MAGTEVRRKHNNSRISETGEDWKLELRTPQGPTIDELVGEPSTNSRTVKMIPERNTRTILPRIDDLRVNPETTVRTLSPVTEELTLEPKMIRNTSEPRIESLDVDVKVTRRALRSS